jgi:uncharacterized protein (DUF697 family)
MGWIDTLKQAAQGPGRKGLSAAQKKEASRELVQMSALAAAAVTLAPLPFVDLLAITPIQAAMVMAVGRVHGREVDLKEARSILVELASVCGTGLLAQKLFATATKLLLPGLGGVLSAPYAFAVTWAMGQVAIRYFDDAGGAREKLRQVFDDALAEGKRLFSREAVEEFRRKRGAEVDAFASAEAKRAAAKSPKRSAKSKPRADPARRPAAKKRAAPSARPAPKKKRPTRPAP